MTPLSLSLSRRERDWQKRDNAEKLRGLKPQSVRSSISKHLMLNTMLHASPLELTGLKGDLASLVVIKNRIVFVPLPMA